MANKLLNHAWTLAQLSEVATILAKELPPTTTLRQALTFLMIVEDISMGRATTMTAIKERAGSDGTFKQDKKGSFKRDDQGQMIPNELIPDSMGRSYQVFLEPTARDTERMGWLTLETDEADNRRKFLRLTSKGEAIALKMAKALKERE